MHSALLILGGVLLANQVLWPVPAHVDEAVETPGK
jgi:hypothetical protein